MEDYNFNAPQYIDFTSAEDLELKSYGEEYFDIDHEIEITEIQYPEDQIIEIHNENHNQVESDIDHEIEITEIQYPEDQIIELHNENHNQVESINVIDDTRRKSKLRRSVSAGDILLTYTKAQDEECALSSALEALQLSRDKLNIIEHSRNASQCRKSKSCNKLNQSVRSKASSKDAINKIGTSRRKNSEDNLPPNKYISVAEAIKKFQLSTPQRYHTQSSKIHFNNSRITTLFQTVPQSPMLATKSRIRAPTCISRSEQEKMEAEQMRKHQIKAQPINYKILQAPVLNTKVEKKPATVPQPFKLTEVQIHKSVKPSKDEVYEFHARPIPKSSACATKSITPSSTYKKKYRETLPQIQDGRENLVIKAIEIHHGGLTKPIKKPVRTKIQPFSFEERDRLRLQKKEQKIKQILEEEKKNREFHARPISNKVVASKIERATSSSSLNSNKNDENIEPKQTFKARPATVIHKKPFIPEKKERPLMEISEFNLKLVKRAKEREEFDKTVKQKEEKTEFLKREFSDKQKHLETIEINKLRKELVHTALPIKHYKVMEIQRSNKKLTSPVSPNITKKRAMRPED